MFRKSYPNRSEQIYDYPNDTSKQAGIKISVKPPKFHRKMPLVHQSELLIVSFEIHFLLLRLLCSATTCCWSLLELMSASPGWWWFSREEDRWDGSSHCFCFRSLQPLEAFTGCCWLACAVELAQSCCPIGAALERRGREAASLLLLVERGREKEE